MDIVSTVNGFFDSTESGDFDAFKSFFTEDAVLWHSFDQIERHFHTQVVDDLKMLLKVVPDTKYIERKVEQYTDGDGSVQWLHVGTSTQGRALKMYSMGRIFRAGDGRIRRIEQYVDSAQATVILDAAVAAGLL